MSVPAGAVGPHAWRLSLGLIRKLHFKFINISTWQGIEPRSPGQKSRELTITPRIIYLICLYLSTRWIAPGRVPPPRRIAPQLIAPWKIAPYRSIAPDELPAGRLPPRIILIKHCWQKRRFQNKNNLRIYIKLVSHWCRRRNGNI